MCKIQLYADFTLSLRSRKFDFSCCDGNSFEGVGCFQSECHITVDAALPPVLYRPRRVPEALEESLSKELDSLVTEGILAKITEPTDWVNFLVCVTKSNGALRLCLDPKDLNRAILMAS